MQLHEREDWLKERRTYLGATDVAGLLTDPQGNPIHPYKTPHGVWLEKKGLAATEENEAMVWGHEHEDTIARHFSRRHGLRVQRCKSVVRHPTIEHFACNPDRLIQAKIRVETDGVNTRIVKDSKNGLKALLQIKTAGFFAGREFEAAGTDRVPDAYVAQCQWELFIADRQLAILAVLIDTNDYREYVIERNDDLISGMIELATDFWTEYMLGDKEPPITGHRKDTEWLKGAYEPKPEGLAVSTEEIDETARLLAIHVERHKRHEVYVEGLKNRIRQAIGENAGIDTIYGPIYWKADSRGIRKFDLSKLDVPEQND